MLCVIDQPILDIVSTVDSKVLERYDLKADSQILAENKHLPLYETLLNDSSTEFVPGGSTLNSLRAAMWYDDKYGETTNPVRTCIIGSVGRDKAADILRSECKLARVDVSHLEEVADKPTARCAILILDKNRTMVTDLSAALDFTLAEVGAFEKKVRPCLIPNKINIIYTSAYYVLKDPVGAARLMDARSDDWILAINLAAEWAAGVPDFSTFVSGSQMVFGTIQEARSFCKTNGGPHDGSDEDVASFIATYPGEENRWAIITQGADDIVVATTEGIYRYAVPTIDRARIVDDNGAGDSFVGAFLAVMVGKECYPSLGALDEAVSAGCMAARVALQSCGCRFERDSSPIRQSAVLKRR